MREPILKAFYLHKSKIYKVNKISRGTDEVYIEDIHDGSTKKVPFGTFAYAFERMLRISDVARLIDRHVRSLYRYEATGLIEKPKAYSHRGVREVRFYRVADVLEIHKAIAELHQGRPRKDKKVVNNTLIDEGSLRIKLRERFGTWTR